MYYVRQLMNGHPSIRHFLHVGKLSASAAYCGSIFHTQKIEKCLIIMMTEF